MLAQWWQSSNKKVNPDLLRTLIFNSQNFLQLSAGRNAFQLSSGAIYSERDCSRAVTGNDFVPDDDLGEYTTAKSTAFKPKAKPQVDIHLINIFIALYEIFIFAIFRQAVVMVHVLRIPTMLSISDWAEQAVDVTQPKPVLVTRMLPRLLTLDVVKKRT